MGKKGKPAAGKGYDPERHAYLEERRDGGRVLNGREKRELRRLDEARAKANSLQGRRLTAHGADELNRRDREKQDAVENKGSKDDGNILHTAAVPVAVEPPVQEQQRVHFDPANVGVQTPMTNLVVDKIDASQPSNTAHAVNQPMAGAPPIQLQVQPSTPVH
ncbi:hypothetical protein HDU76_012066, partial [Blyttiomyces sp. JEL0837]